MYLPPPIIRPQVTPEPPALVRVMTREDLHWNRPMFKAPPLEVKPPIADVLALVAEFCARANAAAAAPTPSENPRV
jgi:hypothetical protein